MSAGEPHWQWASQVSRSSGGIFLRLASDEKPTTNYAIDTAAGTLVTMGTVEGAKSAVSPDSGQLITVGALNVGAIGSAAFDIADLNNATFAAITAPGASRSRWYLIDLRSGATKALGIIGVGETIMGVAIEP